jgi:hypothetical protein
MIPSSLSAACAGLSDRRPPDAPAAGRRTNDGEVRRAIGNRLVNVEVEEMAYNPLDNVGYQKIEIGDRVSVTGEMDTDFFEGEREFVAESVITLDDRS